MEEIILNKSNYQVVEKVLKRKFILHNSENKILFLQIGNGIGLPKNVEYSNGSKNNSLDNLLMSLIEQKNLLELVKTIGYSDRFAVNNNKMKKSCYEIINEYYTYFIEFDTNVIDKIWNNQEIKSENILPYLLTDIEFLNLKFNVNREDQEAIKVFKKKINYEMS